MDGAQQRLTTAQQQELTGLAIQEPSDNPGGTVQLLSMNAVQNQLTQYQANLTTAKAHLSLTDDALNSASSVMQSAYTVALQASSGTNTTSSMQSYVTQIEQLQQQLVSDGNTQGSDGSYLFGGQKTDQAPFTASNGQITYNGDGNSIDVPVGPSSTIACERSGVSLVYSGVSAA